MNDILKVAMIQTDVVWEQVTKNLTRFDKLIESISNPVDLIIFPEMFTTGFSNHPEKLAENMNGDTVNWMKEIALNKDSYLSGSIIIEEENKFYNRFLFIAPDGTVQFYDKRHLFNIHDGETQYCRGISRQIFKMGEWNICPQICYDLRFPVWYRNSGDYDILINVANWPEARCENWMTLLRARAIENMVYSIGVNRIGSDANRISYVGESMAVNPKGEVLNEINPGFEGIIHVQLSREQLKILRKNFPVLQDADTFHLD